MKTYHTLFIEGPIFLSDIPHTVESATFEKLLGLITPACFQQFITDMSLLFSSQNVRHNLPVSSHLVQKSQISFSFSSFHNNKELQTQRARIEPRVYTTESGKLQNSVALLTLIDFKGARILLHISCHIVTFVNNIRLITS